MAALPARSDEQERMMELAAGDRAAQAGLHVRVPSHAEQPRGQGGHFRL